MDMCRGDPFTYLGPFLRASDYYNSLSLLCGVVWRALGAQTTCTSTLLQAIHSQTKTLSY